MGETLDAMLPVLDRRVQAQLTTFLPSGELPRLLATLTARAEHLRRFLAEGDLGEECAAAAHAMAGSAGMLGFERLTAAARRFERAFEAGGLAGHAAALAEALDLSLAEMRPALG